MYKLINIFYAFNIFINEFVLLFYQNGYFKIFDQEILKVADILNSKILNINTNFCYKCEPFFTFKVYTTFQYYITISGSSG